MFLGVKFWFDFFLLIVFTCVGNELEYDRPPPVAHTHIYEVTAPGWEMDSGLFVPLQKILTQPTPTAPSSSLEIKGFYILEPLIEKCGKYECVSEDNKNKFRGGGGRWQYVSIYKVILEKKGGKGRRMKGAFHQIARKNPFSRSLKQKKKRRKEEKEKPPPTLSPLFKRGVNKSTYDLRRGKQKIIKTCWKVPQSTRREAIIKQIQIFTVLVPPPPPPPPPTLNSISSLFLSFHICFSLGLEFEARGREEDGPSPLLSSANWI